MVVKSIAMSTKNWVINIKERLSTWICHPVKDDIYMTKWYKNNQVFTRFVKNKRMTICHFMWPNLKAWRLLFNTEFETTNPNSILRQKKQRGTLALTWDQPKHTDDSLCDTTNKRCSAARMKINPPFITDDVQYSLQKSCVGDSRNVESSKLTHPVRWTADLDSTPSNRED